VRSSDDRDAEFRTFFETVEPRLHRALVAKLGWDKGREATSEAFGYAWEHWDRIRQLENPVGYLFRVGQSRSRTRKNPVVFARPVSSDHWYEPQLAALLGRLPQRQRIAVILIHGYGWTTREVGDLLGIRPTTVQSHLARGLDRLRRELEVTDCV